MHEILYLILYVWEVLFCFMLQVYMYSVWYGYLLSLILFTMIWKLFMNYLHAKWVSLTKYIFCISIYFVLKYYMYIVISQFYFYQLPRKLCDELDMMFCNLCCLSTNFIVLTCQWLYFQRHCQIFGIHRWIKRRGIFLMGLWYTVADSG